MIRLEAATMLMQWAVGGLFFCWFTTRRRMVGLGYGWMLRITYVMIAAMGVAAALKFGFQPGRDLAAIGVVAATVVALGVSILQRSAGVSAQREEFDRRSERVAAMTGIEREVAARPAAVEAREFDPRLDLVAPLIGLVGLVAAGLAAGGNDLVAVIRTVVGALFLGAISDAMLLGHWYLVQPGLPRSLLNELVRVTKWILPVEAAALLLPTGMISVLNGSVNDGWNGTLGYFWVACVITTAVLCVVTERALRERYYSAVMAATGLLYLAILTAFGTDIVARAVLAG